VRILAYNKLGKHPHSLACKDMTASVRSMSYGGASLSISHLMKRQVYEAYDKGNQPPGSFPTSHASTAAELDRATPGSEVLKVPKDEAISLHKTDDIILVIMFYLVL
jgi:hypothetical protein